MSKEQQAVSRRGFLTRVGAVATGGALAVAGAGLIGAGVPKQSIAAPEPAAWPMPYQPLDPEETRKLGHSGYYEGQCSYGAFGAIVGQLQEKVGPPFTGVPLQMASYGEGGVAGWCTLCGALNGACAAITLVCKDYKKLCDELLKWYVQTPFPSDLSNQYAADHSFLVDKYKSDKSLPQTVPESPLCHITVTRWCREHGYASGSSERSERCARISGDVVAFAVEMLNAYHGQGFAGAYDYSDGVNDCRACHKKGKDFDAGQWTRGKMECGPCHVEGKVEVVGADHYPAE